MGLAAPVYATLPVHKMGQMFMYDAFLSIRAHADFDVFSLDDVDDAFARIVPLKFQQRLPLTGMQLYKKPLIALHGECMGTKSALEIYLVALNSAYA